MSAQSKKRLKKRHLKRILPVFLVVTSVVFLSLLVIYKTISKNIASAFSSTSYDLSTQGIYSVLYISDVSTQPISVELGDVYLIVVNPEKKSVLSIKISKDTMFDAPGKFGMETIGNIFILGEKTLDDDPAGGFEYLIHAIEINLGLKVDRYLYMKGVGNAAVSRALNTNSFKDVFFLKFLLSPRGNLITDFSSSEFYSFWNIVKESEVSGYSFEGPEAFDSSIRKFTYNSPISLENKTLVVLNGSQLPGIATFGGRVSENAGIRVIEIGNTTQVYEQSVAILDKMDSLTAEYLIRYFKFAKVVSREDFAGFTESSIDRADITIVLGLDIASRL